MLFFIILAVGLLFLGWYLIIAYYGRFSLDDFGHGINVNKNGFWSNQLIYYQNWEGSFSHTFLANIPHSKILFIIFGKQTWIYCLSSLILLITSVSIVINHFRLASSIYKSLILALYFVGVLYLTTSGEQDILFWLSANFTYVTGLSFLLLGAYFLLKQSWNFDLMFVLAGYFTIGNKLNLAVLAIVIFTLIIVKDGIKKISFKRYLLLIMMLTYLLVNILAPGNFVRIEENLIYNSQTTSFIEILVERLWIIRYTLFFGLPFIIPIAGLIETKILSRKFLVNFGFLIIIFFFIETLFFSLTFNDINPARSNIFTEFMVLTYLCLILSKIKFTQIRLYFSFASLGLVSYSHIALYKQIQSAEIYSSEFDKRDLKLIHEDDINCIQTLPESGLLHSTFSNDIEWINHVLLVYYGKSDHIIICE